MTDQQIRSTLQAQAAPSVGAALARRVQATPDKLAFMAPTPDDGWRDIDWTEAQQQAHLVAAALLALGVEHEQRVAIASSTRIEWVMADLGIACAGAATTAIYPNTAAEDVAWILSDCEAVVAVLENASQLAKLDGDEAVRAQVRHVVLLDDDRPAATHAAAGRARARPAAQDAEPVDDSGADRVLTWAEFIELGRGHLAEHPDCVTDAIAATGPDHLQTLIYTSGTTGRPKGVELTHGNFTYLSTAIKSLHIVGEDDLQYLWLPLSHVFGKALIAAQLDCGFASAVDGRIDRIVAGLGAVHPTFMCGAPRIFEKVRNAVLTSTPRSGVKGRIARWAFSVGRASRGYRLRGEKMPPTLVASYAIADRLVFSKLKARMGGNLRFFMSGSAKLSSQVQEWFYSAGITVVEGYGSTETTAIAFVNDPATPRFGTVGLATPGMEVRLADDGELLLRGPLITRGYHGAAADETAQTIVDGWFHTGDIGELDEDGHLRITDRKKDLIKTSGGKYVAPQKVEAALAANVPYVSQSIVVGEGRKYIVALLTLDPAALEGWAKRHGRAGTDYAELVQLPEVRESVAAAVERANAKLERWETVKNFAILPAELTVDDGGVTPNMKVRRSVVIERHADLVQSLYGHEE